MQIPEYELGQTTIGGLVDAVADQFTQSRAIAYYEYGVEYTWGQFRQICNDVAKAFIALGIQKGDKVAIWANNVPEWLYTQYATGKMGGVLVTINTSYKSFELEYLMEQSDASTLIFIGGIRTPDEYLEVIQSVCPEIKDCDPGQLDCKKLPKLKNLVLIGDGQACPRGVYLWDDILEMGQSVSNQDLVQRQNSLDPDDVINMQLYIGNYWISQRGDAFPHQYYRQCQKHCQVHGTDVCG
jgi:fatty-acyl-CoA synthase